MRNTKDGGVKMSEKTFTVKDVSEILDIEAYVLRYYEKELNLSIHRNNQGHRVYNEGDVERFRRIKELREQGLQLKAIDNMMHRLDDTGIESLVQISATSNKATPVAKEDIDITDQENSKVKQFSIMMKEMLKQALVEYNDNTKEQIKEELSEEVNTIVNRKFIELEGFQKEKDEEYYKKVDETIREMQKLRQNMARFEEMGHKEKTSLWKKIFGTKEKGIKTEEKSM